MCVINTGTTPDGEESYDDYPRVWQHGRELPRGAEGSRPEGEDGFLFGAEERGET